MKTEQNFQVENRKEVPYRTTEVAMERHCQKGPESLEHQGGMGKMERSLRDSLPRTGKKDKLVVLNHYAM